MVVEGNSVTEAWLILMRKLIEPGCGELSPVVLKVNESGESPVYADELEAELNKFLISVEQPEINTTAGTIFPESLSSGKLCIFDRYDSIWPQVSKVHRNKFGTYFRRMMAYDEQSGEPVNQLKHIIDTYMGIPGERKPVKRRSALIATIFDPRLDHKSSPLLGFPCLQQVCFVPSEQKYLTLNAMYAMQHADTRAYGNYLGLMQLGRYMASQMKLEFKGLNCMLSTSKLGKMNKSDAKALVEKYF